MGKKTKVKIFQKFCIDNNMSYDIWFHEKDNHNRTIELNATIRKNKNKAEFFMCHDIEWRISRYEFKINNEWFSYKTLTSCLNGIWEKTNLTPREFKILKKISQRNKTL